MTFTSFFTLFFMGNTSIYNSMMVRDMVSGNSLNSLLSTLLYILSFTIVIEETGAFLIWSDIHGTLGYELTDEIKFSVFHAVSAFCNAGFSTLPNGLANPLVFGSHAPFYLYLSILIMLGGIGFPILVNFKDTIVSFLHRLWTLLRYHHWEGRKLYHAYNLNSRIVLIMTAFLLIVPTICFAVLEWNGALLGLTTEDKLTHAFFMAVCPRSAGFASIDPVCRTDVDWWWCSIYSWRCQGQYLCCDAAQPAVYATRLRSCGGVSSRIVAQLHQTSQYYGIAVYSGFGTLHIHHEHAGARSAVAIGVL